MDAEWYSFWDAVAPQTTAALVGLLGGFALGLAARLGRFCTLAAIEDVLFAGNTLRWRMWVLAIAIAAGLVQLAIAFGAIDPGQTVLTQRPLNLVSLVLGGLMFGLGMALVGTCGFGTLVRLGGGDLKSFLIFLVLGVSAFMAAAGPTAQLRVALLDRFNFADESMNGARIDALLSQLSSVPAWIFAVAIICLLALWTLSSDVLWRNRAALVWSAIVGGTIGFGWLATGWLVFDIFEPQPVQSFSFVRPLGASVMYLMTSSGSTIGFGIGSVAGVLLGSFVGALWRGEARWEASDDAREAKRQILGGFLMGTGGMYALGCTFGEGLSAMSMLAVSGPIVLSAIWLGAWLGLTYLLHGSIRIMGYRFLGGR